MNTAILASDESATGRPLVSNIRSGADLDFAFATGGFTGRLTAPFDHAALPPKLQRYLVTPPVA